jgi:hypothetical protein
VIPGSRLIGSRGIQRIKENYGKWRVVFLHRDIRVLVWRKMKRLCGLRDKPAGVLVKGRKPLRLAILKYLEILAF